MIAAAPVTRHVIAHNDAEDSGNPVHSDAVAQQFNFKGALVPGVTVYGYMTHAMVTFFGETWLERGRGRVRLRRPVYAGDRIALPCTVRHEDGATWLDIEAVNAAGEVCAVASATLDGDSAPVQNPGLPPARALPEPRWPAERAAFAAAGVLGSIAAQFEPKQARAWLDALHEDHAIYLDGNTHPAWLLRQANLIVDRNFAVGPWIHVSSEVAHHARALNGERLEVRARVLELYEKKGHDYVDLDVVLLGDGGNGALLMRVKHSAIYRMAAPST